MPPDIEPRKQKRERVVSSVEHGAHVWGAASGEVPAREGVLRIMDETQAAGLKLGVCSAATKSSAVCVLDSLLGKDRFQARLYFIFTDAQGKADVSCCLERICHLPSAMSYQTHGCQGLDIFLGGDDIERKKPDPSIYITAAERLGVQPSECVVIEDSIVGLKARAELGYGLMAAMGCMHIASGVATMEQ